MWAASLGHQPAHHCGRCEQNMPRTFVDAPLRLIKILARLLHGEISLDFLYLRRGGFGALLFFRLTWQLRHRLLSYSKPLTLRGDGSWNWL
jgi:hypothetical protein